MKGRIEKKHNTGSDNLKPRKRNKRRTNTKNGTIRNKTENKITNDKHCKLCNAPTWNSTRKCPALEKICNHCGKKGHFARVCRQKYINKRQVQNIAEEETTEISGESDKSESSTY